MQSRYSVSDEVWEIIAPLFPKKGRSNDNRLFLDAVYWIAKTAAPWRDLPARFGKWNSVYIRFHRLSKTGFWQKVFERFSDGDMKQLFIDSSVVRAQAAGQKAAIERRAEKRLQQGRSAG